MRYYLISDNHDTLTGMRLAGIEGTLVRDREGVEAALQASWSPNTSVLTMLSWSQSEIRNLMAIDFACRASANEFMKKASAVDRLS